MHNQDINGKELDIECIREFIYKTKIYKPIIHIGGGEPFMRHDLLDIISIIKKNQLRCLITTNGFLMNENIMKILINLKVDVLIFSLYGLESVHDEITGVKGAFKKLKQNLEFFLGKRNKYTKVLISIIPLPENLAILQEMIRSLKYLGIDGIKIEQLNFLSRNEYNLSTNNEVKHFNFSPSTFISEGFFDQVFTNDLVRMHKNISHDYRDFVYFKPHLNKRQLVNWYCSLPHRYHKCIFITHSLFINYNGDIIPCQFFLSCKLGNIKKDSLEQIWRCKSYKILRKIINKERPPVCMRCCKN